MLKLIVEDNDYSRATVVESTAEEMKLDKYHPLLLRGIFARADAVNRNARFYEFNVLKDEMDKYVNEKVNRGMAVGTLEHPADNKTDPEKIACKITKLECDAANKCWIGESRILYSDPVHNVSGTPLGDVTKALFDADVPLGFSTRGCGELHDYHGSFDGIDTGGLTDSELKNVKVVRPYSIFCIDVVSEPSVGIFCEGILESKEFMVDMHGQIVECALNQYERDINSSTKTFDLDKKREIYKAAFDTLLKKL